mmetsp:Transcript_1193/g.1718  ORF Transcript_1193/g.1718 Transcript_1193/m.1718 type:complete len:195 (+) Transcript_1193:256-840(+)
MTTAEVLTNSSASIMSFPKIIELNVGGKKYSTTLETLTKGENMLTSMFSGRLRVLQDGTGAYFVDRDGELFGYILNFLRTNEIVLESQYMAKRLLPEARFYAIDELVEYLSEAIDAFEKQEEEATKERKTDVSDLGSSRRNKVRSITLESAQTSYSVAATEIESAYEVEDFDSEEDDEQIPVEFERGLFTNVDF